MGGVGELGGGEGVAEREREPHSHKQSESPEDWAELNGDNNGKTRSQITNGNARPPTPPPLCPSVCLSVSPSSFLS